MDVLMDGWMDGWMVERWMDGGKLKNEFSRSPAMLPHSIYLTHKCELTVPSK
jgi:hypothetical protein